ncbi:MAG TPA: outer membrane beta-barrel domain-containing protein [Polyangia bacterium]|nr:outer membrane beta-barrel domain-containing protein [Polyangia bacterium]
MGFAKGKASTKAAAPAAEPAADSSAAPADQAAADPNAAPADQAAADPNAAAADPNAAPADQTPVSPDVDLNAPLPTEGTEAAKPKAPTTLSWQDVIVVPRKAFIKSGRVELEPFAGVSINDNLIRHYGFGGEITYFLSDVFSIGVQGQYFVKQFTTTDENVGLQYNRIPTLNRYLYSGVLDFGYVPIYGKYAWFNKQIMHWEVFVNGGVGLTVSEVIPRDSRNQPWKNNLLTPTAGIGARFFLFDWLTVNFALRDYIVLDKYESTTRAQDAATAKTQADSQLVNNFMVYAGVGFYLPTKFTYKTPR